MATPRKPLNVDYLVKLHRQGLTLEEIGQEVGCSASIVWSRLREVGVATRRTTNRKRRRLLDGTAIAAAYVAGASEKVLAERYGVSRNAIRLRLIEAGVPIRGRSDAMFTRMAATDFEGRKRLAAAAHAANRKHHSLAPFTPLVFPERTRNNTAAKQRSLGVARPEELAIAKRFPGWQRQVAVERYNLDFAAGAVAVEVHTSASDPIRLPRLGRRTVELGKRGWHVAYLWLTPSHPLSDRGLDELVAYIERLQRLPASVREYRVVRGSGDLYAAGRIDADHDALIPAAIDAPDGSE